MTKSKFVKLIEMLLDKAEGKEAWACIDLFPEWHTAGEYEKGNRVTHEGILYECLQRHTSLVGWEPDKAPSLWAKVLIPDPGVIPEWEQPGSTNPYMAGDKVRHNEKIWESEIDNNIWEPGIYGWKEIEG